MTHPQSQFLVVGLGASAGGVQALTEFFAHVPTDSGVAYVVILHLSPDYESHLAGVLQNVATIPVVQVTERVTVAPDHVYVIPPNQHLMMVDGDLAVSPNVSLEERRAPVDIFFRTLADSHNSQAVCVVLSGTGADGSMGLKRVKEHGGAVFVQNPREAEFNEMPRNAIATNLVDDVLSIAAMPERIIAYGASLGSIAIPLEPDQRPEAQQQALREIFTHLRVRTGHDFSNYKRPTLLRRIERRINVRSMPDLPTYAAFLRDNPEETQALLKDLLISVTNFFRDKEAFRALELEILPRIVHAKRSGQQIRIWVVGCATGEEAYSVAMLCAELTAGMLEGPSVQIFATDIDENAIAHAREGLYSLNDSADVSPERLNRFFTKEGDSYRIGREIREIVLFAAHNVLKDPPFSHLDLVTCRNVLIYLNQTAQERVMETLHFALDPGGYMFLGTSESVDGASDLYATVSREYHIFQSRLTAVRSLPIPEAPSTVRLRQGDTLSRPAQQEQRAFEHVNYGDLHQQLLEQYAPPSLVVNEEYDIVHLSERVGRYLQIGGGEPSNNLLKLIRPELRLELRSALYQAIQRQTPVEARNLTLRIDDHTETITLVVRPALHLDDSARGLLLVLFERTADHERAQETIFHSDEPLARQLEEELNRVKTQLRLSNEQHEVQAEELKAANEELRALNEELRSSAEELETSKEELQSINEELRTVNQELKIKVEETTLARNNLHNLVNSTEIGTLFLDRSLRVNLFTPAARELFNLIPADYGRPLSDITNRLINVDLATTAVTVLNTLRGIEQEVRTTDNRVFLMRVLPYRTAEDHINGVVLTFIDMSERKRMEEALRQSQTRAQALIANLPGGVVFVVDRDLRYLLAEGEALELSGLQRDDLVGKTIFEALEPELANSYAPLYQEALGGTPFVHEHASHGRWYHSRGTPLRSAGGTVEAVLVVSYDITERKQAEQILQQSERRQAFLLRLGDALLPLERSDEITSVAARVLGEHVQVDRVYYAEVEPDNEHLVIAHNAYTSGTPVSIAGRYRIRDYSAYVFGEIQAGRPVVVADTQTLTQESDAERAAYRASDVRACIIYPLIKRGRLTAVVGVTASTQRAWTDEEVELVRETAERTWTAVVRARAEEALRESEARFRTLADSVPQVIWANNSDGHAVYFNQRWYDYSGLSYEQSAMVGWQAIVHPDDGPASVERWQQALASGVQFDTEYRLRRADGVYRWHIGRNVPLRDDSGRVMGWFGSATDIEELKQAEAALRESEERFRLLVEGAHDYAMFLLDPNNRITFWSVGAERVFGWTEAEALGQSGSIIFTPEDQEGGEVERELLTSLATGKAIDRRWHVTKTGTRLFIDGILIRLDGEDGHLRGFVKIGRDATVQRQAEESLQQSRDELELRVQERTAALAAANESLQGEIIERQRIEEQRAMLLQRLITAQEDERQRIARELHDTLGQHLAALTIRLSSLRDEAVAMPVVYDGLADLRQLASQIDGEIDRLTMELRPLSLSDLGIEEVLRDYAEEWTTTSGVPVDLLASGGQGTWLPPTVETTVYRIVQEALTNILKHAQATQVSIILERQPELLRVIIEDNGQGFNREAVANQSGGGRQMGLVGMAERAALVGGTLSIESELGSGTTIYLQVPIAGER